ncbi:MAG: RIP metalloprotease RseP [Alphaproteobacteria bacterium]
MEYLSIIWEYLLPFVVVLTVLVFVHELGHYWVARRCGVRVEVFSIGFGPELFGWTDSKETRWKISAIPLGGYVKMFGEGEILEEDGTSRALTRAERLVSFKHKGLGQRAAIVFAGPAANFIFTFLVFAFFFSIYGQPFTPAEISSVDADSAAARAGVEAGDLITEVDGTRIERFEDIRRIVQINPGKTMEIVVMRDGVEQVLVATPTSREIDDGSGGKVTIGLLGVRREGVSVRDHNPATAAWAAVFETWNLSVATLKYVGEMIIRTRSTEGLGGPIKIAQMSGAVWKSGIEPLVILMAQLSISLGLINLFPIPMLDGGHLLFYGIEAIRGRPLSERAQEFGFRIGLVLVFSLMLFVVVNDIVNLPVWNT